MVERMLSLMNCTRDESQPGDSKAPRPSQTKPERRTRHFNTMVIRQSKIDPVAGPSSAFRSSSTVFYRVCGYPERVRISVCCGMNAKERNMLAKYRTVDTRIMNITSLFAAIFMPAACIQTA
jgi:hypothetical protein